MLPSMFSARWVLVHWRLGLHGCCSVSSMLHGLAAPSLGLFTNHFLWDLGFFACVILFWSNKILPSAAEWGRATPSVVGWQSKHASIF